MSIRHLFMFLLTLRTIIAASVIRYISTEHPEVTWFHPKYFRYMNLTARRYSRSDPFYYMGFHMDLIWPVHKNINVDFYFYELLSNQYKRSFVELHFDTCDMVSRNLLLGMQLHNFFSHPCPYEAGAYHIENITFPLAGIPSNFPFTKGRIYANVTSRDTKELLGHGHIDMEMKELSARRLKH